MTTFTYTVGKKSLNPNFKAIFNKREAQRKARSRLNDDCWCINPFTGKQYRQTTNVKNKAKRDRDNDLLNSYFTAVLKPPITFCNYPLAACYQDKKTYDFIVYNITVIRPKKQAVFPRLLAYKFVKFKDKESALSRLEEINRDFSFIKAEVLTGEESNEYLFKSVIDVPGRGLWKNKNN